MASMLAVLADISLAFTAIGQFGQVYLAEQALPPAQEKPSRSLRAVKMLRGELRLNASQILFHTRQSPEVIFFVLVHVLC